MISEKDVNIVKRVIILNDKHIFRLKAITKLSGLHVNHLKHIVPRLLSSGFIRVYNRNGRYTLYEMI